MEFTFTPNIHNTMNNDFVNYFTGLDDWSILKQMTFLRMYRLTVLQNPTGIVQRASQVARQYGVKLNFYLGGTLGDDGASVNCALSPSEQGRLSALNDLTVLDAAFSVGIVPHSITTDNALFRLVQFGLNNALGCAYTPAQCATAFLTWMQTIHAARPEYASIQIGMWEEPEEWFFQNITGYQTATSPANFDTLITTVVAAVNAAGEKIWRFDYGSTYPVELKLLPTTNINADNWYDRAMRCQNLIQGLGISFGFASPDCTGNCIGSTTDLINEQNQMVSITNYRGYLDAHANGYPDRAVTETFHPFPVAMRPINPRPSLSNNARAMFDVWGSRISRGRGIATYSTPPLPLTQVTVSSIPQLKAALANNSIDVITVTNGTYACANATSNLSNSLNIDAAYASRTRPVIVQAQTIGGVIFDGGGATCGFIAMDGSHHQTWVGFKFANWNPVSSGVIVIGTTASIPHDLSFKNITLMSSCLGTNEPGGYHDHGVYISSYGPYNITFEDFVVIPPADTTRLLHSCIQIDGHGIGSGAYNLTVRRASGTAKVGLLYWDTLFHDVLSIDSTFTNCSVFGVRQQNANTNMVYDNVHSTGSGTQGYYCPPGVPNDHSPAAGTTWLNGSSFT